MGELNTLYVGNLNYKASKEDLEALFGEYGEVAKVRLIEKDGIKKGFGFVHDHQNPAVGLGYRHDFLQHPAGQGFEVAVAADHAALFQFFRRPGIQGTHRFAGDSFLNPAVAVFRLHEPLGQFAGGPRRSLDCAGARHVLNPSRP